MIHWILVAVYVIGYLPCWRAIAYYLACDISGDNVPEGEWLASGICLGFLVAAFWPLIALGVIVRRVYLWREDSVAALIVPRSVLKHAELERRERRIKALEREMRIGS